MYSGQHHIDATGNTLPWLVTVALSLRLRLSICPIPAIRLMQPIQQTY
jgi:hypothetical protein